MSGPGETVLAVEHLTVRYGRRVVLSDVSLAADRGQVYALLGRNGTGKTSLIRCLLGQQKPSAGHAVLFGRDAWRDRRELMRQVGVVPEEPDAPAELNARQLSALSARFYPRWDAASVEARIERFEVPMTVAFDRLSKGQKGGVMLALALGHAPELLLLDDPTLGLDLIARNTVFGEVIGELADRGTTIFIATHDLAGVEGLADRVGILKDQRLALEGDLEDLKASRGQSLEEIFAAVAGVENGRLS